MMLTIPIRHLTFHGTIHPTPVGTAIDLTVSAEGNNGIGILVYHLFFLSFIILALIAGGPGGCLVIFLIFTIAEGWIYYESFVRGMSFLNQ